MSELNFSDGDVAPLPLFEAAAEKLQQEFSHRLEQLRGRRTEIVKLQALAEHLAARGWPASAEVAVLPYANVVLRLFVTVASGVQQADLLEVLAAERIEAARNETHDVAGDSAYDLTLAPHRLKVRLRIAISNLQSSPERA